MTITTKPLGSSRQNCW